MKKVFDRALKFVTLDMVSTLFLLMTTTFTVISLSSGYTIEGGILAMCDLFILRGMIWQSGYVKLIRELRTQLETLSK